MIYIIWATNAARNDSVHNILFDCFLNLELPQFVISSSSNGHLYSAPQ